MNKEINRQLIEKQAREILDKFAFALGKVEKESEDDESYVDRKDFEREEGASDCIVDGKFKERILCNAPLKDEDFIIAEKGAWK